jgi:hypothetical protein
MSSKMPSGLIFYLSASWIKVGVSLRPVNPKAFMVSHVMTFMEAPRSINVFLMSVFLIFTLTTGLSVSEYLAARTPPIIKSDILPISWTV